MKIFSALLFLGVVAASADADATKTKKSKTHHATPTADPKISSASVPYHIVDSKKHSDKDKVCPKYVKIVGDATRPLTSLLGSESFTLNFHVDWDNGGYGDLTLSLGCNVFGGKGCVLGDPDGVLEGENFELRWDPVIDAQNDLKSLQLTKETCDPIHLPCDNHRGEIHYVLPDGSPYELVWNLFNCSSKAKPHKPAALPGQSAAATAEVNECYSAAKKKSACNHVATALPK